jgi:hypothetical protein
LSLSPEFKETVRRIKVKEPELDATIERDGKWDPDRTIEHLNQEHKQQNKDTKGKSDPKRGGFPF